MLLKNEVGALILRVVLGITFFIHGFVKFQGGIENQVGWFSSIGLPGFLAYVVAIIELVGGFALFIGLGTKVISATVSDSDDWGNRESKASLGFLGNGQMAGYELDLALLAMAAYLAINGSKLLSLNQLISQKDSKDFTKVA